MGSCYFYLEYLLTLVTLLQSHSSASFTNPAVFALEYTLVPEASHPVQLRETLAGYRYVLSRLNGDASRICVSGDSAGATLVLNLLLYLADQSADRGLEDHETSKSLCNMTKLPLPALALLISPWCTLASPLDHNTTSDFLDASRLHEYALAFCGSHHALDDPHVSPGNCTNLAQWKGATPNQGFVVMCGKEEVFEPQILALEKSWRRAGAQTDVLIEPGAIHAWPVAALFLGSSAQDRSQGVTKMVEIISERMMRTRK